MFNVSWYYSPLSNSTVSWTLLFTRKKEKEVVVISKSLETDWRKLKGCLVEIETEYSNAAYLFKCLFTEHIEKLKTTYDHVDDIDLFVGGFLEPKVDDALVGAVFRCIIGDTFARLKYGDRY